MYDTAAVHLLSDSFYFTDVTVQNCTIIGYFQGIYLSGVDGAEIIKNTISNTQHNAVALQSGADNVVKGTVTVAKNYMHDVGDRAIRINYIGDADIAINNNIMVDCGDSGGQLIKATAVAPGATVNLESNYWDGKDVSVAVSNLPAPTIVGITGGNWDIDPAILANYIAPGVTISPYGTVYTMPGDFSGDGRLDAKDLSFIRRVLVSKIETDPYVADVNQDGSVDLRDLVRLKKIIVNYI